MRHALHKANADLTRRYPNYVVRIVAAEGDVGSRAPRRLRRRRVDDARDRDDVAAPLDRRRHADREEHRPLQADRLDGRVQADHRPRHPPLPGRRQAQLRDHRLLGRDRAVRGPRLRRPARASSSTRRSTTTGNVVDDDRGRGARAELRRRGESRRRRSSRIERARSSTSRTPRCGSSAEGYYVPNADDRTARARRVPRLRRRRGAAPVPEPGGPPRALAHARRVGTDVLDELGAAGSPSTSSPSGAGMPGRRPDRPPRPRRLERPAATRARAGRPPPQGARGVLRRVPAGGPGDPRRSCSTSTPSTGSAQLDDLRVLEVPPLPELRHAGRDRRPLRRLGGAPAGGRDARGAALRCMKLHEN